MLSYELLQLMDTPNHNYLQFTPLSTPCDVSNNVVYVWNHKRQEG